MCWRVFIHTFNCRKKGTYHFYSNWLILRFAVRWELKEGAAAKLILKGNWLLLSNWLIPSFAKQFISYLRWEVAEGAAAADVTPLELGVGNANSPVLCAILSVNGVAYTGTENCELEGF